MHGRVWRCGGPALILLLAIGLLGCAPKRVSRGAASTPPPAKVAQAPSPLPQSEPLPEEVPAET